MAETPKGFWESFFGNEKVSDARISSARDTGVRKGFELAIREAEILLLREGHLDLATKIRKLELKRR